MAGSDKVCPKINDKKQNPPFRCLIKAEEMEKRTITLKISCFFSATAPSYVVALFRLKRYILLGFNFLPHVIVDGIHIVSQILDNLAVRQLI